MKKYIEAEMEVIRFTVSDVIATSGCQGETPEDDL